MRVLQVNKFFYIKGGSEAYLFSLIDGLKGQGVKVAEFAMEDPKNYSSDWSKHFVSAIDYETNNFLEKIRFATKIIYSQEAKKKIGKLLNIFKPDIVHLHMFQHQISPSILSEIKKRNLPVIYTAHDLKSICPNYQMLTHGKVCELCIRHRYYNCFLHKCTKDSFLKSFLNTIEMYFHLLRKYYDLIDLVITPSKFHHDKLIEFRFDSHKVVHIPNFVDEKSYAPKYSHDNYFIYFGRLSEEKGVLILIDAMKCVKDNDLLVIGRGPLESAIRNRIHSNKLKNVHLLGFQSGNALSKLVRNSMFSIIPSKCYENGPISLLESFAYGKPVIGANIGGIPEHITHGEDGLIFKAADPEDLADKINSLIKAPNKIPEMGKKARTKIEKVYSKKLHVEKILHLYNQLINKNLPQL